MSGAARPVLPRVLATCALVFAPLAGAAPATPPDLPAFDRVRVVAPGAPVGEFELTDHAGRPFHWSSLRGRTVLVAFGFTHCPDVCPTTMQRLAMLKAQQPKVMKDVAVVLVSVDGERDTPAALKAFLGRFSPDFLGLTGPPAVVRPVAERFAAAFFPDQPDPAGNYLVGHSPQVFVVDAGGRLRAEFYSAGLEAMAGTLAVLASQVPAP